MSNVVSFKAQRSPATAGVQPHELTNSDVLRLSARVASLQGNAESEIWNSIFLLDLAAQHARLMVSQFQHPQVQQNLSAQINAIEQLLQVARAKALNL
jgi:hypothetical protein